MKRFLAQGMPVGIMMCLSMGVSYADIPKENSQNRATYTKSAVDLSMGMRKLWEDHNLE